MITRFLERWRRLARGWLANSGLRRGPVAPLLWGGLFAMTCQLGWAADQPQWGQAWTRNMISAEQGLPDSFDPKSGQNIKWTVKVGTQTHGTPIVAGGRVYIGTNNGEPRDPKHAGDRGVLMCFDEATGQFLWQLVVPKREDDPFYDWPDTGMSSPVTVEGDRVYMVDSRGEVVCLDARGMANGNDGPFRDEGAHMALRGQPPLAPGPTDADIIWVFDLVNGAGIWSHDGAHSSILIDGPYLYLNSGTGVDNTHAVIRTPDAPSLVVIDKRTGRLVARDRERIAPDIFHCTWSSPSLAVVQGRRMIFFAGGNGVIYAFEALPISPLAAGKPPVAPESGEALGTPQTLKKIWQFNFDPTGPKGDIHKYLHNHVESPSNVYGMPVFYKNRLYVAGGGDLFWGKNEAWLKCIDVTGSGDISTNGLIWSYPLHKHVMSTPAIADGLVFIADCGRGFHCVDAETGQPYWTDEIKGEAWASPLVADGKVYLGTRSGAYYVYAASKEKKLLSAAELVSPISGTTTAANGTLYVATMNHLFAIAKGHPKP